MEYLFAQPYWIVVFAFAGIGAGLACGGHTLVRRSIPYKDLVSHNDVAGFLLAVVGVIYAVLIAFVVIVVWQQYNDAESRYGDEVSSVADIHASARALPLADAKRTQKLVHQYVLLMISEEWPAMRTGGNSAKATAVLDTLMEDVRSVDPQDGVGTIARERLSEVTQHAFDLRNRRLSDNAESLPPVLWLSLVFGAVITVGFGYLFGVEKFRVQLLMTASVAALIALMFVLLVEFDYPFRRDSAISSERWVQLERYLDVHGDAAWNVPLKNRAALAILTR